MQHNISSAQLGQRVVGCNGVFLGTNPDTSLTELSLVISLAARVSPITSALYTVCWDSSPVCFVCFFLLEHYCCCPYFGVNARSVWVYFHLLGEFPNSSSARLLDSGMQVSYLGDHFGLVWIRQMSLNSLELILCACSSLWSGDLWLLTYFFAALLTWAVSGWVFGKVVICVAAQCSSFLISCQNSNRLACASNESVGVVLRALVAWSAACHCTLPNLFMWPLDPLACPDCRVRKRSAAYSIWGMEIVI